MGGWSAGALLVLSMSGPTPNETQCTVALTVWIGPLALLSALRKPPPPPQLAGERMATQDDLRPRAHVVCDDPADRNY